MKILNKIITTYIIPKLWCPSLLRRKLLNRIGAEIDINVEIRPNVFFNSPKIKIGSGSFINRYCKLFSAHIDSGKIIIGKNVFIGMDCLITCITHEINNEISHKRAGKNEYKSIIIEDGCWIGARVTILPGIRIRKGCIIAAGAVVTKDTCANSLYAGVPAKKIKNLTRDF
ncbi:MULTISPECIES: acyltransferase [Enterococcus]|uniref:acyltransferase n=1 Tax=Enterococcus TaxID=1350 RepID=UPI0035D85A7C